MSAKATWLTGSGGFIGRHLVRVLRERSQPSIYLTNNPAHATREGTVVSGFQDRLRLRGLLATAGVPAAFIHLGWGAMEDPGAAEHLTQNVADAKALIDVMFDAGVPTFVFVGSTNEYGARTGLLREDMPAEGHMTNYALGKAAVTAYGIEQAHLRQRTFVAARVFYTYGAGQRAGSLINKLVRCRNEGVNPDLGPCDHFRDYIHAADVAAGLARCCAVRETGVINLGSGTCWQVKEFVTLFWRELGGESDALHFGANPMRAGEPEQPRSFASLAKLQRLTGWRPELTLDEGIRLTIHMLRGN